MSDFDVKNTLNELTKKANLNLPSTFIELENIQNEQYQTLCNFIEKSKFTKIDCIEILNEASLITASIAQDFIRRIAAKDEKLVLATIDLLQKQYGRLIRLIYWELIWDEELPLEEKIKLGMYFKNTFEAVIKVHNSTLIDNQEDFIKQINEQEILLLKELEAQKNQIGLTWLEHELIKAKLIGANSSNVAPMPLHPITKKSTEYLYQNEKMDWLGERIALLYLFNLLIPNSLQDTRLKINHFVSKYYTFKGKSATTKQVENLKSHLISKHINNTQKMKPDYLLKIEEIVSML